MVDRRATRAGHGCRAAGSWSVDVEGGGGASGGQFIPFVGDAHAAVLLAACAGRVVGLDEDQSDHGLTSLGNDDLLPAHGVVDQPGQTRFGLMDVGNFHGDFLRKPS